MRNALSFTAETYTDWIHTWGKSDWRKRLIPTKQASNNISTSSTGSPAFTPVCLGMQTVLVRPAEKTVSFEGTPGQALSDAP